MSLADPFFWTALATIIGVNVVLSGDNAVVIALAARSLPPRRQRLAIRWGAAAAIVLRVVLTFFAVALLELPWLKLAGSALLLWIGIKLLVPDEGGGEIASSGDVFAAIRTILAADLVMSVDNVIAVAAAAGGQWMLLVIGLAISIPIVIFGAGLLVRVMERLPVVVPIGAALIGFVAGKMAWEDHAIAAWTGAYPEGMKYAMACVGAGIVVIVGQWLAQRAGRRALSAEAEHPAR